MAGIRVTLKSTGQQMVAKLQIKRKFIIFVLQGYAGDPENGNEKAENHIGGIDYSGLGKIMNVAKDNIEVYIYVSSTTENTKNAVLEKIKQRGNEKQIIMVGHSMGADNIVELTKENKNIIFDFVILLDIKDASNKGIFSIDDDNIHPNVKNVINYYQEGESIGGEKIEIMDSSKTKGINVLSPGSNHRSIDNDLIDFVIEDIKNFIEGKDAVKIAKDRKLPTFDPKKSNSPNISFNDYENKPNRA